MSQAGAVAIAYTARNPARIESLLLYGAYSKGERRRSLSPEALEENDLFLQLMRVGWGRANPAFGRIFTAAPEVDAPAGIDISVNGSRSG